ncbi:MAG: 3-deoxy-D-manno-octulosonic acid transferase, partial [Hylemonella sp.]|nr:3-deoxy-D-manno-octulosonic acid transferase [Hylemonella sp.]
MMRALYSLFMTLAQPLLRRKLARRGRVEPGYLEAVEERFGRYGDGAALEGYVWVHAVSLGETRAAAILIERLRERLPDMRLLLTHGTATGRAEGARLLRPGDTQAWLPWDTRAAVGRFLAHFKPRIGILMETEIWPNLIHACAEAKIPLTLVNARLSDKSLRQALSLPFLARPAYAALVAVWAQTQADSDRLKELGAPVRGVVGNLKFDAPADEALLARGRAWRAAAARPVLMFASSREGEEAALLRALRKTPAAAGAQWLIVPRHPQRFDEVAALVQAEGFSVSRRSEWSDAPQEADIWIGDSLGEMPFYYGLSDAALLGGSFEPLGGQNLIEAAACGCPVIMGTSTFNFAEAAQLAQAQGAALRMADITEAVRAALGLAMDGPRREAMALRAVRFAAAHRGAADRTAQELVDLLAPKAQRAPPRPAVSA